jgi:hypothetical protein
MLLSLTISSLGATLAIKKELHLIILSILSSTVLIAAFSCFPLLNHDYQSLFKIRSTWGKVLLRENISLSFEDAHRGNDTVREFL